MNTEFAGTSAKQISADSDVITEVEQLPEFVSGSSDGVFLDIKLQPLGVLLQVSESGLAHQADRHDASRDANSHARRFQFLGRLPAILRQNLRYGVAVVELP